MKAWREMAAHDPSPERAAANDQRRPPVGVAVFAADTTIRSITDPAGEIQHWSAYDRGGHFPAMEAPDLLAADIRTFFRAHR